MTQRTRAWLQANFQERDPQDFHDDLIDTFGVGIARQVGTIYYQSYSLGDDTYDGQSPQTPFKTLQAAIDACTANVGDVIVKMRGGEEVTAAVNFNKSGITVVAANYGASPQSTGELFSVYAAASFTDGPVANITERCTIIGLGFVSRDTGALFYDGAAMLIGGMATALPFGVHILECRFPKWNLDNRIGIAIEGSSDCHIERCYFEGVGADFDSGIYVQGATANLNITDCFFRDCTYAIVHGAFAGGGPDMIYKGNVCMASKLLSNTGACVGIVADNFLMTATDAGSYNDTVNNLNALGIQFAGNQYAE